MTKKVKYIREDDPELSSASEYTNYLIDAYKQTGDIAYRDEILSSFDVYFKKYVAILHHKSGGVNTRNKDTKNFLRLFMKAEDRAYEAAYFASAGSYVHMIRRTLSKFTVGDIYHEIIVHFLELLECYKPITYKRNEQQHRISFPHYIQVNIRYRLCRWIIKKSKDIVTGRECLEYCDTLLKRDHKEVDLLDTSPSIDLYGWVWGDDAGIPFVGLTEMERYLIWLRYEGDPSGKKLSKRELSDITGYHWQTITYRLDKIKSKITRAREKENVLDRRSI